MKRGEKLKVYFSMNNRCYKLFNIIQLGKDGKVDLKITDFYNNFVMETQSDKEPKGYLGEEDLIADNYIMDLELSYHQDGSFLRKNKDTEPAQYRNPYGVGERWTATDDITDYQPIMYIAMRRMAIYNRSVVSPIAKRREKIYVCKNDELFEKDGTYLLLLYIRNKKTTVNRFTTPQLYSDILTELSEDLDLCIFIQRYSYPKPEPYFSKAFNRMVYPYPTNSIGFCNKDEMKDEMMRCFGHSIFNPFLKIIFREISDDQLLTITKEMIDGME